LKWWRDAGALGSNSTGIGFSAPLRADSDGAALNTVQATHLQTQLEVTEVVPSHSEVCRQVAGRWQAVWWDASRVDGQRRRDGMCLEDAELRLQRSTCDAALRKCGRIQPRRGRFS